MSIGVFMEKEEWKPIPEFEGFYEASNMGEIRSLQRTTIKKNGCKQFIEAKVLKQSFCTKGGTPRVTLCNNVRSYSASVNHLVLLTFLGQPDQIRRFAHHKDGNPKNNKIENLFWGTRQEKYKYKGRDTEEDEVLKSKDTHIFVDDVFRKWQMNKGGMNELQVSI